MTRHRTRRALPLAGALLTALLTAAPVAALSPAQGDESEAAAKTGTGRTVVGDGHIDIGPRFDDGTWTVQIRDDTVEPPTWRNTDDVVLHVTDAAGVEVPGGEEFSFLGEPGGRVWLLPQAQQAGVLWPGWNSQEPEVAARVEREVTWQLTGVEGPGDFVLFLNGSFGAPQILFDGRKPLPQETGIETGSHVHGNWAFTEPGTYLIEVRMSATTKDGTEHEDTRTLRFSVGPQNPERAFAAAGAARGEHTPGASAGEEERTGPARDDVASSGEATDDSTAPLWWGVGAAALVAAVAGTLVWRRGRGPSAGGGER
ncbi:TIGR03773 family transporter-associated surface protein [Streptomyces sp. WMMC500]|uniref:TIGR03773 family transporter-associated surface protein n=1 Tax=Streptomyces sp. WMMC500 TaxID=3015154 RepID=UPI00248CC48A|nr:TIGR03773 family transporter-associated surface protein [Streptomyces sp. WMMC500]WBB63380.1 TIGR03773 family transporter-associated surface protein [Streptomyces sp. WMMC500]